MRIVTDTDINCSARRILVQHWVDLGRISIRTTRGVVYLNGTIAPIRDAQLNITPERVTSIAAQIQRIQGVRRLQLEVSNSHAASNPMAVAEPATS